MSHPPTPPPHPAPSRLQTRDVPLPGQGSRPSPSALPLPDLLRCRPPRFGRCFPGGSRTRAEGCPGRVRSHYCPLLISGSRLLSPLPSLFFFSPFLFKRTLCSPLSLFRDLEARGPGPPTRVLGQGQRTAPVDTVALPLLACLSALSSG